MFVGHLASVGWTGAGINPARTFGPQVVSGFWPGYSWLYYVGQFLGTIIATLAYVALKSLDYEEVVGGNAMESENAEDSANVSGAPMMQALTTAREKLPVPGLSNDNDTASIATNSVRDLENGPTTPGVEERDSHETAISSGQTAAAHQPKWISKQDENK